jgi:hypothetical protein
MNKPAGATPAVQGEELLAFFSQPEPVYRG